MTAFARRVHPLVWAASAAVCALLFLLGALSYRTTDREIPPGTDALVQVQQVGASEADALATLQRVADKHKSNLLLVGSNPAGPDAPPWYFAFIGNRQLFNATFINGDYPAFSPGSVPRIFPGTELADRDQPIRGTYALQGHSAARFAVADALEAAGFDVTTESISPTRNYLSGLFESVTWPLLVTAMTALALAIVYSAGADRKAAALKQFHGWRTWRIVGGQVADLAIAYAAVAAVVLATGTALLLLYNRGHQFGAFIPWVLLPMAAAAMLALSVQVTASRGALALPAYAAVKGARPIRLLTGAAALSHIVTLILVFIASAQAGAAMTSIAADTRTFARWGSERESVVVQVNPNAFEDPRTSAFTPEVATAYASFGRTFRQLAAEGTAILSFHQIDGDTGVAEAPLSSYEPLSGNSLIVNSNYLARHPIRDASGRLIKTVEPAPDTVHLLIPKRLAEHASELSKTYAETHLAAWDPIGHREPPGRYAVKVHITADQQGIFNYGNTWNMSDWVQDDPVVAVVSAESRYISDWVLLGGAANNGNVIFTDAKRFHQLAGDSDLMKRFSGVNNPATHASQQLHERNTRAAVALGNVVAGIATLLIAMALLAAIYADAVRFSSFLKRTHGWSAARIHWPFIAIAVSLSTTVILAASILLRPAGLASASTLQTTAVMMSVMVGVVIAATTVSLDRRAQAGLIARR